MIKLPKPEWSNHSYPAICQSSSGNWYALKSATKPIYFDDFKEGREVCLPSAECEFLQLGTRDGSPLEDMFEVRPVKLEGTQDE